MFDQVKNYWESISDTVILSKREFVLGAAVCVLSGVVAGMLLSPRKTTTLGSNNSNIVDKRGWEEEPKEEE